LSALELLTVVNQVLFVGLFVAALRDALRERTRTSFDRLLLFGSIAGVVVVGYAAGWLGLSDHPLLPGITVALLSMAPLAMIRLVSDFRSQPVWVNVAGHVAFLVVVVVGFVAFGPALAIVELALLAFFALVGGYAALAFAFESRRVRGITRRRMMAVAAGAGFFIGAITVLLIGSLAAPVNPAISVVTQILALGAVIGFWIGFMPPPWIRRGLREPELRRFMARSIRLAGVADDVLVMQDLQAALTDAFGADGASIGIATEEGRTLRYLARATGEWSEIPSGEYLAGRAFSENRSLVVDNAPQVDPEHADQYRRLSVQVILATPIRGERGRLGVVLVYSGRQPIFAEDDIALLELLADHLAVLLETRSLMHQASEMRAREEAARLKEEFLASAAHDLRSPLTVVLGQAELLERRVTREPDRPIDPAGLVRLAREARRLRDLVNNLLDAQRLEQGGLGISPELVDVGEIAAEVQADLREEGLTVRLRRPERALIGTVDRARILQVLTNLVENARKYGPADTEPEIVVERDAGNARIAVVDRGIGIPEDERERVFERFYRASNAQRVTDTGLGLGLSICRRIVEEHGGRIWHEPTPGGGSTFVVTLPLTEPAEPFTATAAADAVSGVGRAEADGSVRLDTITSPSVSEAAADA
jgi:signal transduction histidine kinase